MTYSMILKIKKEVYIVTGKPEFKETDSINSVQSSLKSHPVWVTLYIWNWNKRNMEKWESRKERIKTSRNVKKERK